MSEAVAGWEKRLRLWVRPAASTFLHPQWLAFRLRAERRGWLIPRAAGHALDVGCADQSAASELPGLRGYVGMDLPATARGLYGTRPHVFGDAADLPFGGRTFDCVLMLDVLEHVPEPERALSEVARVLKPGGRILVTIPFAYPLHDLPHDYQRFTRPGLRKRLVDAGFEVDEIHEAAGGIESAMLVLALTLTRGVLSLASRNLAAGLLLLPVLALVPVVNVAGWALSRVLRVADFLPGAYFVRATKT